MVIFYLVFDIGVCAPWAVESCPIRGWCLCPKHSASLGAPFLISSRDIFLSTHARLDLFRQNASRSERSLAPRKSRGIPAGCACVVHADCPRVWRRGSLRAGLE